MAEPLGPDDPDLLAVVAGFARALRSCGVAADPIRTQTAARALTHVDVSDRGLVHAALAAALCSAHADRELFDLAFALYFGRLRVRLGQPNRPMTIVRPHLVAVEAADAGGDPREDGPPAMSAASEQEVLHTADFAALTESQRRAVRGLIAALRPTGPSRISRRRRRARTGAIDRPRTARETLRRGGEPALRYARPGVKPRRLVLLVDVSGSMASYADAYLRFAHAVVRRRPHTEVFTIGTRLTRVSRQLAEPDPDIALHRAGEAVPDWSGGTRLGAQLRAFNARWGRRGVARGAVVVIFSDGWERGGAEVLAVEMAALSRLAHRIVWVNPHRGQEGFLPATAGMQAALPSIDVLHEGHSYESLQALAALLSAEVESGSTSEVAFGA